MQIARMIFQTHSRNKK
ncbi:hypothetical protein [Blautia wexlerae]